MAIVRVGVIGAGFMGSGIAQICAQAGLSVVLVDAQETQLKRARGSIAWSIQKLCEKDIIQDGPETVMARIDTATSLDLCAGADLVLEAVYEDIVEKKGVLRRIAQICPEPTILGSNTSTIPITRLAEAVDSPGRMIGIHFFGPVPLMKLVEIVPHPTTNHEVTATVLEFTRLLGKNPVLVKQDIPGFLMNRVFGVMVVEAIHLVASGAGTVADIDQGMCDGFNMRVGPLAIADAAGLDIVLNACRVMYKLDPLRMPEPPALLIDLVAQGNLGAKTGQGFYHWDGTRRLHPVL